jgi:large subunit ribosomal protein L39e
MPSQKRFKTKVTLAKKQKQNRPIPQWIRMRTDNKIRYAADPRARAPRRQNLAASGSGARRATHSPAERPRRATPATTGTT